MANLTLPSELISLIHHVELNRVGWWEESVQRLILAAIWLSDENLTLQAILESLRKDFQVNLHSVKARAWVDALCSSGVLVSLPGEQFKISESALKEFEKNLEEATAIERIAKNTFTTLLKQYCPLLDGEEAWHRFNEQFLLPLVREIGAKTYQLISGRSLSVDTTKFEYFLQYYPLELHTPFRTALNSFLDPQNPPVRSYILRSLNAYFFMVAANLGEDTLNALTKLADVKPSLTVFVDTNFLFSILALHENPSNETALLLVKLMEQLSGKVEVKLYVLPPTVDEAKRVLIATQQDLTLDSRLTPNLAEAALQVGLSGVAQKFVEESKKTGYSLRVEDYFGPYIKNLIQICRAKGIEFFNERMDHYGTDQEVIDDLNQQLEFEEERYGSTAKRYKQLEHDMVLWHFVRDKRPSRVESPLEAGYWLVTVDYRLLGFDAFKGSSLPDSIPVCIHPSTLIQMLQFWVPRTPQFEEAMLSSMRLPFLFQEFGPKAEKVTIRILQTLSRFENAEDLPKETVTAIFLNNALRQKLSAEADIEKQVKLVREALIEEHKEAQQRLKEMSEKAQRLKRDVDERNDTIQELQQELEVQEHHSEEIRRSLEERMSQLENKLQAKEEEEEAKKRIQGFIIRWLVAPILLIALSGASVSLFLAKFTRWGFWWTAIGVWSLLLMLWTYLTDRHGLKDPVIRNWQLFRLFHKVKNWLFAVLLSGILVNALWDWLKTWELVKKIWP